MNEEKMLQEFGQSAKQVLRGKYPFDHVALERNVVNRSQRSIRYMKVVKVSRFAGVAACLALLLYATNPVWSNIFPGKEDMNQAAATSSFQDEGFSYALSHGYPTLPAIKTEQAGYTIQVKDIMVDQLRIAYTVMISGDKIEAMAKKPEEERQEAIRTLQTSLGSRISDIGEIEEHDLQLQNGKHYLIEKVKYELRSSEMKKILSQPNPVLPLLIADVKAKVIVASVSIPVPKKVIDEQKVIMPTAAALAEIGDQAGLHKLRVTEIQAFPTAMRVVLQADMKDGYKLIALTNGRLVDEQGKQYAQIRSNSSLKQEGNTSTYYLEVIPSLYLGQQPKKLNLQFDGIRTAAVKRGSFTLKLNGKDPLEVPIGDKKLRILRSYYENGKLVLVHPDEPLMAEMAFGIDGQQMPQEYDSATGTFKSSISVAKKDEYQIEMKRAAEEASNFTGSVPILDDK